MPAERGQRLPGADRRLVLAERRYRALAERLPLTTYVAALDVQGSFTYISPQVEALLGYTPEEWLADGRLWLRRLHPDDRARVLPLLVGAHRGDRPFQAEYRLLHRSGAAVWVRDESSLVRDEDGAALFIQGTWTEITGRKALEREAHGRGLSLKKTASDLSQLVSAASHELNAPLRRIVNLAGLLERKAGAALAQEHREILERIAGSAERMRSLVAGLAEFAELETAPGSPGAVPLDEAFDAAKRALADRIAAARADVSRAALPVVWGDPAGLERIFFHLLDNALKFGGGAPPRVHASAEPDGGFWRITVRDHGAGIDPRQAARVFDLFERLDSGGAPGLGLGLALSRRIVERQGGRIWVESSLDEGSSFRFTVPSPPPKDAG